MKLTFIEWMIIVSIILIILTSLIAPYNSNYNTICKGNYLFSKSIDGPDIQIINDVGTGIKCN